MSNYNYNKSFVETYKGVKKNYVLCYAKYVIKMFEKKQEIFHAEGKTTVVVNRAASRVAVLPVRYGIALNPPSSVSVGISTKEFLLQSYVYEILKSTSKYTKGH